jgi:hypothetical protein
MPKTMPKTMWAVTWGRVSILPTMRSVFCAAAECGIGGVVDRTVRTVRAGRGGQQLLLLLLSGSDRRPGVGEQQPTTRTGPACDPFFCSTVYIETTTRIFVMDCSGVVCNNELLFSTVQWGLLFVRGSYGVLHDFFWIPS